MMKYLFVCIHLVFIFCITELTVAAVYDLFVSRMESSLALENRQTLKTARDNSKKSSFSDYHAVVKRDLFKTMVRQVKKSTDKAPVAPVTKKIKPVTPLRLELKGTITGTGAQPMAIILNKADNSQLIYATGDSVDRAVIKSILRERVIVVVDGREETLLMAESKPGGEPAGETEENAEPLPDTISQLTPTVTTQALEEGFVNTVTLSWEDVALLKENAAGLSKQIRIRPHFSNGVIEGVRVTGVRKESIFATKLGLKNGDILSAVNETEIRSINDISQLYTGFDPAQGSIATDLAIQRNGTTGTIRYSIE